MATLPSGIHPFAIAWDSDRKRLWVAADCPPGVKGINPCDRGALLALTATGRIVTRIAPAAGSFHPGDVSAAPGGVFVSDGQNGAVYQLAKSGYSLTAVISPGVGKSGQGTALDKEGRNLLVSDYSQGLGTVDLETGNRRILLRQDGNPLRGIDGLVRCGSVYYGIYNGSVPGSLVKISTSGSGLTFEQVVGRSVLLDPTQIAFDGKRLIIVANSGWATIDKPDFERLSGAPIVSIPLREDCEPQ